MHTGLRLTLGTGGRIVLPAAVRREMQVKAGDTLVAWVEEGVLHLTTADAALRQVQRLVQTIVPPGTPLVEELLEDRRREADAD